MAIRIEIIIVYRSMDIALFIDVLYVFCLKKNDCSNFCGGMLLPVNNLLYSQ